MLLSDLLYVLEVRNFYEYSLYVLGDWNMDCPRFVMDNGPRYDDCDTLY